MTTLREAAQQALEALHEIAWSNDSRWQADRAGSAITALRDALAQPEQEQEQEPVAWMFQHSQTGRKDYVSNDGRNGPGRFLVMNPRYTFVGGLYTAPPRREWQGLTEDEISAVDWDANGTLHDYARAVEAALKEKNNG